MANAANTPYTPSRTPLIVLLVIVAIIAAIIVFLAARSQGIKDGRRQAREKIEAKEDITAGPTRLQP